MIEAFGTVFEKMKKLTWCIIVAQVTFLQNVNSSTGSSFLICPWAIVGQNKPVLWHRAE